MAAIDETSNESWGEYAAYNLQRLATELFDHGDQLRNNEQTIISNRINGIRNVLRDYAERKEIINHNGVV